MTRVDKSGSARPGGVGSAEDSPSRPDLAGHRGIRRGVGRLGAAVGEDIDRSLELRIPRALFRHHEGNKERLVSPSQARREHLDSHAGIFICTTCLGELTPRVHGERRVAYFAHKEGQGPDCERRSGGGWEYQAETRGSWSRSIESRQKVFPLLLTLVPRRDDALLLATGRVLAPPDYDQLAPEARVASVGIDGTVRKEQLHWSRDGFQVKVVDPMAASIKLVTGSFSAEWRPDLEAAERIDGFLALVATKDGKAVQPADLAGAPTGAWIIHRAEMRISEIARKHGLAMGTGEARALKVAGSVGWYATKLPWSWDDGRPRKLFRALGIHLASKQRPLTILPVTGGANSLGDSTSIRSPDGRARLLVKPELSGLVAELIPLPYHPELVKRLQLPEAGQFVESALDEDEQVGSFYVIALDPSDSNKFLSDHRVTIIRESSVNQSEEHFQLGVMVREGAQTRLITPYANPIEPLNFREFVVGHEIAVDLVAPPRTTDGEIVLPEVELVAYRSLNPGTPPTLRVRVDEGAAFRHALRDIILNSGCADGAVGVRFGNLGEIRLTSSEALMLSKRPETRAAVAKETWYRYEEERKKLSTTIKNEIVAATVPATDTFGWASEINAIYRIIRRERGRTAEAAAAVREFLLGRGVPPEYLPDLPLDDSSQTNQETSS